MPPNRADLARHAANHLRRGNWIQHVSCIGPLMTADTFCIHGALNRACAEYGVYSESRCIETEIMYCGVIHNPEQYDFHLPYWNDVAWRTKEEVINLLERYATWKEAQYAAQKV